MNVGGAPVRSRAGLVTTVGWSLNGETTYALEGSVFNAGSAIQWLRDELQIISTSHECDILAESVPDSGGIYLVPAFTASVRRIGTCMRAAASWASRAARRRRTSPAQCSNPSPIRSPT